MIFWTPSLLIMLGCNKVSDNVCLCIYNSEPGGNYLTVPVYLNIVLLDEKSTYLYLNICVTTFSTYFVFARSRWYFVLNLISECFGMS